MILLQHPNILKTVGISLDKDFLIIMELCKTDLRTFIKSQSVEYKEVLKLLIYLTSALAHMHSQKMIHRDLKPLNIMLDFEGNLRLADFGLASRIVEG